MQKFEEAKLIPRKFREFYGAWEEKHVQLGQKKFHLWTLIKSKLNH
jgi:hypothetical protein